MPASKRAVGTYSFRLKKQRLNDKNECPIYLEIRKQKQRGTISLRINANIDFWDSDQERLVLVKGLRSKYEKEQNNDRKLINDVLDRHNIRAKEVLDEFAREKIDWTVNQFKDAFMPKTTQNLVLPYFENHIASLKNIRRFGNAGTFNDILSTLKRFDPSFKSRTFNDIDLKYVRALDEYMDSEGIARNTRRGQLSCLRTIYNLARQAKIASENIYPFGKHGFRIAELEEETAKRYLPTEYLHTLKTTMSLNPCDDYARKVFLLSYYLYGMSFIDMAYLTKDNIVIYNDGRYIEYKRHKTQNKRRVKPIKILMTEEIDELIEQLSKFKKPKANYLLPIITVPYKDQEKLYLHMRNYCYKTYSKYLRRLSKSLDFKMNVTSYVSRHTTAMTLQSRGVSRDVISVVLGHGDMKTTNTYLDSLDNSVVDKAGTFL